MLKRIIIIAILIIISFVAKANIDVENQQVSEIAYIEKEKTVDEMILEISPLFNQDPFLVKKIIFCESGGKISSHDGGMGTNITGIHDRTFDYWLKQYTKETGETLNKDSSYDQIKMTSWAFSKGESYRNAWTTYRAYINGGTYTFYSSMLGRTYTSRCK